MENIYFLNRDKVRKTIKLNNQPKYQCLNFIKYCVIIMPHTRLEWPVWLKGWVIVYKLSGCGLDSRCSHL